MGVPKRQNFPRPKHMLTIYNMAAVIRNYSVVRGLMNIDSTPFVLRQHVLYLLGKELPH